MIKRDIVLERLDELLPELKKNYKVKEIGLFGSVVRDEYKTGSDIDFLVEFEKGADLFDLAALGIFRQLPPLRKGLECQLSIRLGG